MHKRRWRRDTGASLVEYALIITLIALTAIGVITAFGFSVNDLFDQPTLFKALS